MERRFYGELDNRAAQFVDDVESALANGSEPHVTSEGRPFLAQLIYNQFKRSREFFETVGFFRDTRMALEQAVADYEDEFGPVNEAEKSAFFHRLAVREHTDYVRTRVLAHQGGEALSVLSALTPVFGVTPPNKQFVVSGVPVVILPAPAAPRGREYWMPINPTLAIGLVGPTALNRDTRVFSFNAQQVRRLNQAWTAQSESFAGQNRDLVRSLAHPR